jgi:type IV secretory pathway VirB10-like protein
MRSTHLQKIVIAIAMFTCATAAMAQYVWLNDKGIKQYSDMPPPPSVPNSKILKTPRGVPPATTPAEPAEADSDTAKKAAPPTTADKDAEYQKRRAEQAEKDKKADEKAKQEAAKKKNCESAQAYNRALASGERISRVNASGEREYLSDEQRAAGQKEAQRALADCK